MIPLVFIIGQNKKSIDKIHDTIGTMCEIKTISKSDLLMALYQRTPNCILLLDDELDQDSIALIDSTMSLEYVPTICISYEYEDWQMENRIDYATYIGNNNVDVVLVPLIQQSMHFSTRYKDLHTAVDTYDVLNEEIKNIMNLSIESTSGRSSEDVLAFMKGVYSSNDFLDSVPGKLWIVEQFEEHYRATLLDLSNEEAPCAVKFVDDEYSFDYFRETGYIKNKDVEELSDIATLDQIIPEVLMQHSGDIENVACFAMNDVMLIALNFGQPVKQLDLNIIKAATIKLDLLFNVESSFIEVQESFVYTMNALARAAEGKDDVTGHHIKRVNIFSKLIARNIGMNDRFISEIEVAAQMHDVGKIFVPESILNKPGRLTDEEFDTIKQHTVQGAVIIGESKNLEMAAQIARHHHEKFDGSGYPDRLAGDDIPLSARIVCLADIYDALRSPRSYKPGFTHEEAYDIIVNGDGRVEPTHFDPAVLKAFMNTHELFDSTYNEYAD